MAEPQSLCWFGAEAELPTDHRAQGKPTDSMPPVTGGLEETASPAQRLEEEEDAGRPSRRYSCAERIPRMTGTGFAAFTPCHVGVKKL